MPKIRRRVVCGLSETIATFPPHSPLTSVDLPTFGRPATATNPLLIEYKGGGSHARRRRLCTGGAAASPTRKRFELVAEGSQLEVVGQEFRGSGGHHFAIGLPIHDPLEIQLHEPLTTAAAGRSCDRDRLQVSGSAALRHRPP